MNFKRVDKLLESYLPEMEEDLKRLVEYPSINEVATEGAPFGKPLLETLEKCLEITKRMGFVSKNMEGYCGFADVVGLTDDLVGVMAHLDVVPANAAEWDTAPFQMTKIDDRIYGRGTLDDKGPLIMTLYAAKALRESGVRLKKTVRFIIGCDEELDMRCMDYYKHHEKCPEKGFTPDAQWPVVVGEKGVLHYQYRRNWGDVIDEELPTLVCVEAGDANNIVPGTAKAIIEGDGALPLADGIEIQKKGHRQYITARGAAVHASMPETGNNAITLLLRYLGNINLAPAGANICIQNLVLLLEDDTYGTRFEVDNTDNYSCVTNVPTILKMDKGSAEISMDLRYCVTEDADKYIEILSRIADQNGYEFHVEGFREPLNCAGDSSLARELMRAYREVTNDMVEPIIIGGRTYASVMPGFLAFGPEPLNEPSLAHQANEYVTEQQLIESAKIYARAIYYMAMS